ncbi:hypothetical protein D3C72_1975970 [compost metagenome]
MNSMFDTRQPARQAMAMPSPLAVSGFVVYKYTLPAPPVASTVCSAANVSTLPVCSSCTYRPWQCGWALRWVGFMPSLSEVIRSMAQWCSNRLMFGWARTFSSRVTCTACPVASAAWMMRRWLCPPSRVRWKPSSAVASRVNGTPCAISHSIASRPCSTM